MNLIKCEHNNKIHKDCFARTNDGRCEALNDCKFKCGRCHFYKTKEQRGEELKGYE